MRLRRAQALARRLDLSTDVVPYIIEAFRRHEVDMCKLLFKEMT